MLAVISAGRLKISFGIVPLPTMWLLEKEIITLNPTLVCLLLCVCLYYSYFLLLTFKEICKWFFNVKISSDHNRFSLMSHCYCNPP